MNVFKKCDTEENKKEIHKILDRLVGKKFYRSELIVNDKHNSEIHDIQVVIKSVELLYGIIIIKDSHGKNVVTFSNTIAHIVLDKDKNIKEFSLIYPDIETYITYRKDSW